MSTSDSSLLFSRRLLSIGALSLRPNQPYIWTSGIHSPVYCDNRLTLSHPLLRAAITSAFAEVLRDEHPGVECIAGTATAGIPQAALIADRLGLPMVYVRSSAKGHGKQNLIEGRLLPGQRVAVVEDTISTGGSALAAVAALRAAGVQVHAVLAIFAYGFTDTERAFQNADVALHTLTDFATLIQAAQALGMIEPDETESLMRFREDPKAYA